MADAVRDWLAFGLSSRDTKTVTKCTILAKTHIMPALEARKLRDLSADDIDKWLTDKYYSCCFPVCDRAAAQRGT